MIKIGITGASGFIGRYVLASLRKDKNLFLRPLYRRASADMVAAANIQPCMGDLNNTQDCVDFCRGLEVILHLAHTGTPMSSASHLAENLQVNLTPSLNLIQAIREHTPGCKVIYASSAGAVYGLPDKNGPLSYTAFKENDICAPESFYGIQKYMLEHYFRAAAELDWLSCIVLRISNPYGVLLDAERKQGIIGIAMQQAILGCELPIYGSLDNVRDYIHLDDVVSAFRAALSHDTHYDMFNISAGTGHSLQSVLDLITRVTGLRIMTKVKNADNKAVQLVPWVVADPSKAKRILNWSLSIDLESGIRKLHASAAADTSNLRIGSLLSG